MRRFVLVAVALFVVALATACAPPNPGPGGLYLGQQSSITPKVTPKSQPVTWGAAPVIDAYYGGTLYAGTTIEQQDPRPAALPGNLEPLRLWVADPDNGLTSRPAIVWLHGGGFAVGIDSMWALANDEGQAYAKRGYVGFSVEYRIDTTLIGTGSGSTRPPSLCQWVQDNQNPGDPTWEARKEQCFRNIVAAQRDALAAIRWIRQHAPQYGVDPNKIAVAGFSAGAVTASNVAYQHDDVGTVRYFTGDDLAVDKSKAQAAFGASGCTYADDGGAPQTIGAGDAPVSFIHSRFDQAVAYGCVALTVTTARAQGLVAELTSYCNESLHAEKLYAAHMAATDTQWTTFLARELGIYSKMPPPASDPVCPTS
jgi:dienelactone hydrolase